MHRSVARVDDIVDSTCSTCSLFIYPTHRYHTTVVLSVCDIVLVRRKHSILNQLINLSPPPRRRRRRHHHIICQQYAAVLNDY